MNDEELGVLDRLLEQAPDWLEPEGLLGIISFHSLEDRRADGLSADERLKRIAHQAGGGRRAGGRGQSRSRSAKWRVAQRLAAA